MNEVRSDHDQPFDTRRQAHGALILPWSGASAGILGMVVFVSGPPFPLVGGVTVFVLSLVLFSGVVWGWRSGVPRERVAAAVRNRDVPWWRRDTFVAELAARRVGWNSTVVVWINRTLLVVGVGLLITTVVELTRIIVV